jgi:hypothetical protein
VLVGIDLQTIADRGFALGNTSVGEAWKLRIAIGMRRYSKQGLVLLDEVFGLGPLDHQMVAAVHESRIVEVPRLDALDKGAWPAAAAAASIVLEEKELEVQKPSADPDNYHLPYGCRQVEVLGLVHDRYNTPGQDEEAVGDACQRQMTLYASFLGQA